MGMFPLLTSFLALTLSLWLTAAPAKHKRGEGLLKDSSQKAAPATAPAKAAGSRPIDASNAASASAPAAAATRSEIPAEKLDSSTECPTGVALDQFYSAVSARHPDVAPQGAFFIQIHNGQGFLHRQSTADQMPEKIEGLGAIDQFASNPDRRMVWALEPSLTGHRLVLWKGDGKGVHPIETEKDVSAAVWSADGTWIAFTSNRRTDHSYDLYRYSIATGQQTLLAELNGYHEVQAVSPHGKSVALVHAPSTHLGTLVIWRDGQPLVRWDKPVDPSTFRAAFTADSKNVFFTATGITGRQQVFLGAIDIGGIKPLATEKGPVEQFSLSPDGLRAVSVVNVQGASHLNGWQLNTQGSIVRTVRLPDLQGAVVLDAPAVLKDNPDGHVRFFYAASDSARPFSLWYWDGKNAQPWFGSQALFANAACASTPRNVETSAKTSRSVLAQLYLPTNAPAQTPFILHVHDGPDAQFRPVFSADVQYFVARGFGVLALNARGSTGYGSGFEMADNGKSRVDAARDLLSAVTWLRAERKNQQLSVSVFGEGSGGWLIAEALSKDPAAFKAIAVVDPLLQPKQWLASLTPLQRRRLETEWQGTPDQAWGKNSRVLILSRKNALDPLAVIRQAVAHFEASGKTR